MKILVTGRGHDGPDSYQPGIFELDQARALRAAGHDVRFAAVDTRSIRRRRPLGFRKYTLNELDVYYCALPAGGKPDFFAAWAQHRAAIKIWKQMELDGWRPDIIHSHFGVGFLPLARAQGIPVVYTEHFSGANSSSPSASELRREKETYALADRLICVGNSLAELIRSRSGVEVKVVPNIVDTSVFTPAPEHRREDAFYFVATGNLLPVKGFDLLLKALAELRDGGESIYLTVIGDGPERNNLLSLTKALGLEERVRFTGRISRREMLPFYHSADAFVLASRAETFGVVYIEAMAAGLPVIATMCGGPEDFVEETNGILIPTEDVGALVQAMKQMIKTRETYDSTAIAAFAREKFSPARIASRLTAIYEEVLPC